MKTFNFYCDESCHLENDGMPFMLISYVSSAYNQIKLHHEAIRNLKAKHTFKNEIKWSSVSKAKYGFYADLIDYFFTTDLRFRAVVVDKSKIKLADRPSAYDEFYYKMYYQLIYHKISMEHRYNIYLDIKDTLSAEKVRKLKDVLNMTYGSIRTLQNIHSHESLLMQVTDLLMGAIAYKLRGLDTMTAKNRLIERIERHATIPLTKSTSIHQDKMNLFFITLK